MVFSSGLAFEALIAAESAAKADTSARVESIGVAYSEIAFPSVESVGPKVSGELVLTAIYAVLAAIAAVLFYIWLRFEWQFSLGAVAALVHDVILTIGIFSILQIQFDLAIIAALLTIVGYSLNDTVVVFDRVRENLVKYKVKPLKEVLNLSINVVVEVMTVRLSVSLIDRFSTSFRGFTLYFTRFSRTRSKTTTVSFNE